KYTINANDQLKKASDYNDLVIAYRNGAAVKLSDVAKATEGAENTRLTGWMNTTEAVIMNVQRQPGANVIEVVDRIQALLPQLRAALPASVDLEVLTDRTNTIRASVADVEFELVLAVVLVVLVIFVFLRSTAATVIPSLSVPLSLVGTLAVMYLAGFSLNNLSLMAMTIATGFVVDDAIVMIENISRYIEAGDPPLQAALRGSEQIGFTIISLTVSLLAIVTLALTVFLYIVIPKGFFPVQDTGLIQGISEAPSSVSFAAMAERQQALADAILKDPDVVSLSSFIGVDGTNTTLNSGRLLINLRPRNERSLSASDIIRRINSEIAGVRGISLYMQPVQ